MFGNRLHLAARPSAGPPAHPRANDPRRVIIVKIIVASLTLATVFALAGTPNAQGQGSPYATQQTHIEAVHVKAVHPHHRVHVRATRTRPHYSFGSVNFGRASWYTGRIGACGRVLTGYYAASRTLPCGSKVQVSYGGRSIVVTVLDRGPNSDRLTLDLSRSAFGALAPLARGVLLISWRLAH
jgi:rare lipoprotein A (peptidoglycan hydrolase)